MDAGAAPARGRGGGHPPDIVLYQGSTYELEHVEPWTNHLGVTYFFGVARKVVS